MREKTEKSLYIYTLGHFYVTMGDNRVMDSCGGVNKTWNVFKYLLTHRDAAVPGEVICEVFWPETPWKKARHSLYNTIYRLRTMLGDEGPESSIFRIRDGMFSIHSHGNWWLDADAFRELCQQAQRAVDQGSLEARDLFEQALDLYKGDFLVENFYDDWVKNAQNRYRSLYKKTVIVYADLLLAGENYLRAREVCEAALQVEPLEEELQLRRISAYIDEGNLRQAKAIYEEYSSMLYQESAILPSKNLRGLYQRMQVLAGSSPLTDLEAIQELLDRQDDHDGAYFCDSESFQKLYRLERKRMERNQGSAYLIKIDLSKINFAVPSVPELDLAAKNLQSVLQRTLRRGDVVCRWNDAQYLILLTRVANGDVTRIMQRVTNQYKREYPGQVILRIREREIRPEESSLQRVQELP